MSGAATTSPDTQAPDTKPKKSGGKRLVLLAVPLLLAGVLAGLWFTGLLPRWLGLSHPHPAAVAKNLPPPAIYIDLPEMVTNLNSDPRNPRYVKLVARIEVSTPRDADLVRQAMPRLQDLFQTYMREMRPDELRGSAGIYRLREELINRADAAAAPARIDDVLFIQLLIQ